jgi:transcriptional regulator with XRE-family HTH domain
VAYSKLHQFRYIEQECSILNSALQVKRKTEPSMAMLEPPRVGQTLATLRQQRQLSLDELSRLAGVSKSMLSQIERNQANPTVAVVWRLANALDVPLAELLQGAPASTSPHITTVAAHATPAMRAPDESWELRILGPIELAGQFEWYRLELQPGAALVSEAHEPGSREHVTVLSGGLRVESGEARTALVAGETARYAADQAHALRQEGNEAAVALLVVMHPV